MKSKNIKEFKALILRYESITLEEIHSAGCDAQALTGLGKYTKCILCIAAQRVNYINDFSCTKCLWFRSVSAKERDNDIYCINEGKNKLTYYAMSDASYSGNDEKLLQAYRERAKHMRSVLKKLRIKQP